MSTARIKNFGKLDWVKIPVTILPEGEQPEPCEITVPPTDDASNLEIRLLLDNAPSEHWNELARFEDGTVKALLTTATPSSDCVTEKDLRLPRALREAFKRYSERDEVSSVWYTWVEPEEVHLGIVMDEPIRNSVSFITSLASKLSTLAKKAMTTIVVDSRVRVIKTNWSEYPKGSTGKVMAITPDGTLCAVDFDGWKSVLHFPIEFLEPVI